MNKKKREKKIEMKFLAGFSHKNNFNKKSKTNNHLLLYTIY